MHVEVTLLGSMFDQDPRSTAFVVSIPCFPSFSLSPEVLSRARLAHKSRQRELLHPGYSRNKRRRRNHASLLFPPSFVLPGDMIQLHWPA